MTLSSASNLLHHIPKNSWGELTRVATYYSFWHPCDPVCSAAGVAGASWVNVNLFKANPKPTVGVSIASLPTNHPAGVPAYACCYTNHHLGFGQLGAGPEQKMLTHKQRYKGGTPGVMAVLGKHASLQLLQAKEELWGVCLLCTLSSDKASIYDKIFAFLCTAYIHAYRHHHLALQNILQVGLFFI